MDFLMVTLTVFKSCRLDTNSISPYQRLHKYKWIWLRMVLLLRMLLSLFRQTGETTYVYYGIWEWYYDEDKDQLEEKQEEETGEPETTKQVFWKIYLDIQLLCIFLAL